MKESVPKVKCYCCGKNIPKERVKALLGMNVPLHEMTVIEHSTTKKKKGIYMGEVGTSEMKIVDKIYSDTVRSIFKRAAHEIDEHDDEEAPDITPVDPKTRKKYEDIKEEEGD